MNMSKEKKGWRISGNNLTVGLLIIALALVSFNYLQTMNLMVQLDEFSKPVLGVQHLHDPDCHGNPVNHSWNGSADNR